MLLRVSVIVLVVYGGLLYLTYFSFTRVPTGFIPSQDKGYLLVDVRLPDSASLERTQAVMAQVEKIARGDGTSARRATAQAITADHGAAAASPASPTRSPSPASRSCRTRSARTTARCTSCSTSSIIATAASWAPTRSPPSCGPPATAKCRRRRSPCSARRPSMAWAAPAASRSWSATSAALGLDALQEAADGLAASGNEQPGLVGLFSAFRAQTPQMYVDIDRERCKAMGVPLNEVFLTLQLYLGGYYTNDFNQFGRTWQVNLQGDPRFRLTPEQVRQLKVRNLDGRDGAAGQRRRASARPAARRWSSATTASPRPRSTAARCPASAPARSSSTVEDVGRARAAAGHGPAVDRADAAADSGRQHGDHRVRRGGRARLPRPGRAVRKPDAAAGRHSGRADVPAVLGDRRGAGRHGHQHLRADRLRRARRPGQQERDSDRRIRQGEIGPGRVARATPRSKPAACACGRSS